MNAQWTTLTLLASTLFTAYGCSPPPPPPPVRGELRDFLTGRILSNVHVRAIKLLGDTNKEPIVAVTDQAGRFEISLEEKNFDKYGTYLEWFPPEPRQAKSELSDSTAGKRDGTIIDAAMRSVLLTWGEKELKPPKREALELGVVYADTGAANALALICKDQRKSLSEDEIRLSALVFLREGDHSDWIYNVSHSFEIGSLPGKVIICATREKVKVGVYTGGADAFISRQYFTAVRLSDMKRFYMSVTIQPKPQVLAGHEYDNTVWLDVSKVRDWLLREVTK
jgi:hypothetical protein